MNDMQEKINQYYERKHITPVGYKEKETLKEMHSEMFSEFNCPKKKCCRKVCYKASNKSENFLFAPHTDGTYVSQYYQDREYKGDRIPRIVVVSLSAPEPYDPLAQNGAQPDEHEPLNPHWRETLAMVRSLLHPFVAPENFPTPARSFDKSAEIIGNLFVHVRTAKCCSNAKGSKQEPGQVYANCGPYFTEEMRILEPDVIVTQGNPAHWAAEGHAFDEGANTTATEVDGINYSIAHILSLKHDSDWKVYWLRTYHPCYGRYYSWHAGPKIDSEQYEVGAMRKNLVRYGEEIKQFMDTQGR